MRVFQVVWDYIAGSLLTTLGDIVKRGAAVNERMPVGLGKTVLGVNDEGDDLEYRDGIEIATQQGDIIKRGAAACAPLEVGLAKTVLGVNDAGDDLAYRNGIELASVKGDIIKRGAAAVIRFPVSVAKAVLGVNDAGDDLEYRILDYLYAIGINGYIKVKVIEIGNWDMVATATVNIAHGLTLADIINFSVVIREDVTGRLFDVGVNYGGDATASCYTLTDANNVSLTRLNGGYFFTASFDETPYNRGFITIWYKI